MAEGKHDITIDAKLRLSMDRSHAAPNGAEDLIKQGAYIHTVDSDTGETLLHIAAGYGNIENIRWLIQKYDMSPNILDYDGNTPAHSAAAFGQIEAIIELKTLGADLEKENIDNETIELLLENFDPDLLDEFKKKLSEIMSAESTKVDFSTPMKSTKEIDSSSLIPKKPKGESISSGSSSKLIQEKSGERMDVESDSSTKTRTKLPFTGDPATPEQQRNTTQRDDSTTDSQYRSITRRKLYDSK